MTPQNPTADVMRKLVAIRKGSGLSAAAVAQRMNMQPQAVNTLEQRVLEHGRDIMFDTLIRYCRAVGVRLSYEVVELEVAS